MSNLSFPPPEIIPFHRLYVYDSLMMNAQRWNLAQEYHRRRQNVHYQALNQAGIVCGLGVCLIDPPESTEARFRDQRWIEIQPGIAIDVEGNVIVVDPEVDRCYRIAAKAPTTGTLTVYVVVSYVEPEIPLHQHPPETLKEQFRFDQKTTPPAVHEIELCRIQLSSGSVQIQYPEDVLFPQNYQLDLRYRQQAQARPLSVIRIAQLKPSSYVEEKTQENLSYLMQAVSTLASSFQGDPAIKQVTLPSTPGYMNYDLLYLTDSQFLQSNTNALDSLKKYLEKGGVLLIESQSEYSRIPLLIDCITSQLETSLQSWHELQKDHPLRSQPFLFTSPPIVSNEPVQLWNGGGVILTAGQLSNAWGGDEAFSLSRSDIRSAHEFGINILNFAYRRRYITQLLQSIDK